MIFVLAHGALEEPQVVLFVGQIVVTMSFVTASGPSVASMKRL
ncbi:MAG TPA: hypothetical protein VF526_03405 [Solirubrobacteraceae bacterium]